MNAVAIRADTQLDPQTVASEAAKRIASLQTRIFDDVVEIGRELIAVKEAIGHGNFTPWLNEQFGWTERTARNYMSVAEQFASKRKCVSGLPLATVYKLAAPSTPAPIREKLVERLEAGEELSPDEIVHEVKEAVRAANDEREAERKIAARNPKLTKDQVRAKREKQKEDWAARQARDVREREERQAVSKQAAIDFVAILTADQRKRLSAALEAGASHYLGLALDASA